MRTINATVVLHGHPVNIFASGETNFFGKFRDGITVSCVDKDRTTTFINSMESLTQLNQQITETLRARRANVAGIDRFVGFNHDKIAELKEMQSLFVRIFVNDDCHLAISRKLGPPVPPKPPRAHEAPVYDTLRF